MPIIIVLMWRAVGACVMLAQEMKCIVGHKKEQSNVGASSFLPPPSPPWPVCFCNNRAQGHRSHDDLAALTWEPLCHAGSRYLFLILSNASVVAMVSSFGVSCFRLMQVFFFFSKASDSFMFPLSKRNCLSCSHLNHLTPPIISPDCISAHPCCIYPRWRLLLWHNTYRSVALAAAGLLHRFDS